MSEKPFNKVMKMQLDKLYKEHKELDNKIKILYNNYTSGDELYRLKTKKLWLKDEIYRIERRLKD